jgi:hypothetical protein
MAGVRVSEVSVIFMAMIMVVARLLVARIVLMG